MCNFVSRHGLSIGMLSLAALLSVASAPAMQDGAPPRPGGGSVPIGPRQGQPQGRPGGQQQDPGAVLGFHDHMENAGRAFRGLGRAMRGGGAGEAADPAMLWRSLDMFQGALVGAKSQIETVDMSEAAKAKFGEDRQAFQKALRTQLHDAIKESLVLEEALLNGNTEAATQSAQKLNEFQREGHELFQPREEGGGERPGGGQRPRRPGGRGGEGGGGQGGGGGGGGDR